MQLFPIGKVYDFMSQRRLFVSVAALFVLASAVLLITPGPRLGPDFVGGTEVEVAFNKAVTPQDVRRAVAGAGFSPGGEAHTITVSIGLTCYGPERDSFSLLMRCADTALYAAKRNGRNRVESLP